MSLSFNWPRNKPEADQKPIEEVKAKAEAGDAESEVELARRYDKGEGVAKDHAEAAKWYRKAAEQNVAGARYDLALCYAYGEGVTKDQVEAVNDFGKPPSRITPGLNTIWESASRRRRCGEGFGGGGEVVSQSRRTKSRPAQYSLALL